MTKATAISEVSNDAANAISTENPYTVHVRVEGTTPFLFHRWSVDGVEAKSKAAKGSKAKREDDIDSYVYRDENGLLSIPGEYFRMAAIAAAKFRQDPRSPRKSAMDLFKAGLIALTDQASLGVKDWDYVDRRRVQVQRNGITRCRPAINSGWGAEIDFLVNLPEYIRPSTLHEVLAQSGRLVGVGDFRPTFGRFAVTEFKIL